jgi:hypothetical protein
MVAIMDSQLDLASHVGRKTLEVKAGKAASLLASRFSWRN